MKGADGQWAAAEEVADALEEAGAEDEAADGSEWLAVRDFLEIPLYLLAARRWHVLCRRALAEDIFVLESRALLTGLKMWVSHKNIRNRRLLILVDSMGVCLSFDRARCNTNHSAGSDTKVSCLVSCSQSTCVSQVGTK